MPKYFRQTRKPALVDMDKARVMNTMELDTVVATRAGVSSFQEPKRVLITEVLPYARRMMQEGARWGREPTTTTRRMQDIMPRGWHDTKSCEAVSKYSTVVNRSGGGGALRRPWGDEEEDEIEEA